ncbi:hypothetical protein J6590_095542 [Homalodisca vitripennis]|nr:hypothetical protein J6590_095542 [Homalodisca vitripennis]
MDVCKKNGYQLATFNNVEELNRLKSGNTAATYGIFVRLTKDVGDDEVLVREGDGIKTPTRASRRVFFIVQRI